MGKSQREIVGNNDKRNRLLRYATVVCCVWLGCSCAPVHHITILSTNDMHGAIDGFPSLATVVQRYRAQDAAVLLLDAGDKWTGNGYVDCPEQQGAPMIVLMNRLGYDGSTLGNHAFDFGQTTLSQRLSEAKFPVVVANLTNAGKVLPPVPSYFSRTIKGVRIGFVGLLETSRHGHPSAALDKLDGIEFANPIQMAPQLRRYVDSCDVLVGITHLGLTQDSLLAKVLPQMALIIGGHSHTLLSTGVRVGKTLITQTGSELQCVGVTELSLRGQRLIKLRNHLIRLDTVPGDSAFLSLVELYKQNQRLHRSVGQLVDSADHNGLLNLVGDAIVWQTDADVSFYNSHGVRLMSCAAGDLTEEDLLAIEPFGNKLVETDLRVAEIEALILDKFNEAGHEGHVPDLYPAGVRYRIERNASGRGVAVRFEDRQGNQLIREQVLRVVLNDYVVASYQFSHPPIVRDLQMFTRDVLRNYLQRHIPVQCDTTRRVVITDLR